MGLMAAAATQNGYSYNPIASIIYLMIWIAAIYLAVCNNKGKPNGWLPMVGAILFPEIYIAQYVIRKYGMGTPYGANCALFGI